MSMRGSQEAIAPNDGIFDGLDPERIEGTAKDRSATGAGRGPTAKRFLTASLAGRHDTEAAANDLRRGSLIARQDVT